MVSVKESVERAAGDEQIPFTVPRPVPSFQLDHHSG